MLALLIVLSAAWNPPTTYVGGAPIPKGTPILYNIYQQKIPAGGTCEYARFYPIAENYKFANYTLAAKLPAGNWCVMVTAIVNGVESSYSNVATFTVP